MFCFRSRFSISLIQLICLVRVYDTYGPRGWNYLNIHCRNNDNKPVEWWYIYKPPLNDDAPFIEMGRNFTYITDEGPGRWHPSYSSITSNSMLQHTLSPIYRPTYVDYLAVVIYESHSNSEAFGVLMADEESGVWISHTVPGLVKLNDDHHEFPKEELANGHLLMCVSVDLWAVNDIATAIQNAEPTLTYVKIPEKLEEKLPLWEVFKTKKKQEQGIKTTSFLTNGDLLHLEILSRPPKNRECLYKEFAASQRVVLNLYSQTKERLSRVCDPDNRVRGIGGISLKFPEKVKYIRGGRDKAKFAVSTAVPWQKLVSWPPKYWTCVGNLDTRGTSTKGGLIACIEHFDIWYAFDNLKIKEPEC